jgi:hypothetical protein
VRLLGGRLAAGEVRGQLALNGVHATAAQLRQVRTRDAIINCCLQLTDAILLLQLMSKQGYVDGREAAESLPGGLTVWRTILHCALLRLPESLGRHCILNRYRLSLSLSSAKSMNHALT